MQQHPVPQNISSYEFKLVGDMTLKQFFQIAGGVVIALIFYATPLPGFIKWPLILIFGGLGAALAFLPFEGRPLSDWIFAFIKAIYSPTLYVYSASTVEDVFAKETASGVPSVVQGTSVAEYLAQPAKEGFFGKFEQAEKAFMQKMTVLFQTTSPQTIAPVFAPSQPPSANSGQTSQPTQVPIIKVQEELSIPQSQAVKVGSPALASAQSVQSQTDHSTTPQPAITIAPVFFAQTQPSSAHQAVFMPEAGPPSPPDRPNTVVGQVLTAEGKIIDGAILEIRDSNGKPVRAIRTNKVGHFLTVTPLSDGEYEIQTEKEGFVFDNVKFRAESKTIEPILIRAK